MEEEYYQYCFFSDDDKNLFMDRKMSFLESMIPQVYQTYHKRLKQLSTIMPSDRMYLDSFLHFVFDSNNDYQEIAYCSDRAKKQGFNLFHEYYYYLRRSHTGWKEEDISFIRDVISFEEKLFQENTTHSSGIDYGMKGLVKSELYRFHNYQTYHQK